MSSKLIFLLLLVNALALKIQLVDEDYVEVLVGFPSTSLKLMIDPNAPFTYLFANVSSNSAILSEESESFDNIFGHFEGKWRNDFFYLTEDKLVNFRMDYIFIEKKQTKLDCDGVIGLGYSSNHPKGNIYDLLSKMTNILTVNKVLSYDKKKKLVTIGEFPYRSNNNPVVYSMHESDSYPGSFITLTAIGFITDKDRSKYYQKFDINDDAMLTLMPVVIAPEHRLADLDKKYLSQIQGEGSTVTKEKDEDEFWTDVYITKPKEFLTHTEVHFGKFAYKFKPFDEKGENKYRAKIRYGNFPTQEFKHWYLGIDIINIDRVDYNFETNTVKLYSSNTYDYTKPRVLLLLEIIIFITIFGSVLTYVLRLLCSKPHQKDIKKGEELELL